jgi:phage terminase small subunit
MKGRKPEIHALSGALNKPPPAPAWLPKFAKADWARVVPAMVRSRSLAAHELSTLESCIAVARIRECEAVIQKQGLTFVSPRGKQNGDPKRQFTKRILRPQGGSRPNAGSRLPADRRIKAARLITKKMDAMASIFDTSPLLDHHGKSRSAT